ncbi:DUF6074 family protein [Bradyrhizobium sp. CB82]|uniref:DUF6074 family protein n=1 Tax=Bradyrhizobium sp. CB82 TaxID=3039159 RepID=UPI0024B0DDEC|nr:DUF6074 family protein [Bradyrhizobium sp. CB82]WFU44117.1 DUF6074 family protein [Bradyrhizobium sp. CB82]
MMLAFPNSRNAGMVNRVAAQMSTKGSVDDAEDELAFVLEVIAGRLEDLGVAEGDIDRECHDLARAAWQRWQQLQLEAGAA